MCKANLAERYNTFNLKYTVAAICNTHTFESAHPQSYINAHTLTICRFEVNSLHINPIIGEIWLIYIHFQQKFPYFSNYVTCRDVFTNRIFYFQSVYTKRGFPKFGLFFSKTPGWFSLS